MSTKREVLARLLEHCEPAVLPNPWSQLPGDAEARSAPHDPAAILARLIAEYTEAELIEAGVANRDTDGTLAPGEGWSRGPGQFLLPLRAASEDSPFDILGDCGLFSGSDLPVFAVLQDSATRAALDAKPYLFVAANMADVVVLRRLGWAATLPHGLENLRYDQLVELCERFGLSRTDFVPRRMQLNIPTSLPADEGSVTEDSVDDAEQGSNSTQRPPPNSSGSEANLAPGPSPPHEAEPEPVAEVNVPTLVVIGFDLANLTLERSTVWQPIQDSLSLFARHLEVSFAPIFEWRLIDAERERLQFLFGLRAVDDACNLLWHHFHYADAHQFVKLSSIEVQGPQAYSDALNRLYEAVNRPCRDSFEANCLRQALDAFLEASERDVIRPLTAAAMMERSLLRRELMLTIASLSRTLQEHEDLVSQARLKLAQFNRNDAPPVEPQLGQRLALVKALVVLYKCLY